MERLRSIPDVDAMDGAVLRERARPERGPRS